MSDTTAGLLQLAALLAALAACYRPLGDYLARVVGSNRQLRAERAVYRLIGVDGDAEQSWPAYLRAVLAFSAISVLFLYALQRVQQHLWLSLGLPAVPPGQAWNTAVSFVTNTNWQSYSGETTMGHLVQMAGLAVQNFVSAAVGLAVAIALVRGFTRSQTDLLGNFWVDLIRLCLRVLLPISVLAALVLIAAGAVQNLDGLHTVTTLAGQHQGITGEVEMRADNHQLVQPLFISSFVKAGGKGVKYDVERTGMGFKTEGRVEAKDTALPTTCKMERP